MSTLTHDALTATRLAPTPATEVRTVAPGDVLAAVEAFKAADAAAEEARQGLTREQAAGVADLPPDAEFLFGEAQYRFEALLKLTGLDHATVDAAAGYTARHRVVNTVPTPADWRESVATVDWSRGRGGA